MSDTPHRSRNTKPGADQEAESALPLAPASQAQDSRDAPVPGTTHEADPLARWREAREIEEEMSEMFDEDRVTHQHGGTQPEAD